jgi:O-antigen ligase/tetratricopeptide (TPR) repeat protein
MTLEKLLKWAAIIGVFLLPFVPLIVTSSMFFPFITGKNFAFRVIVEAIFGVWLALALITPKYRPRRSLVLGALALFVAVIGIADLQGAYPFKSFWSNYERMDGWVTIAHVLAYTVVAASVITTENLWRVLFKTSLAVSVWMALSGFAQITGLIAIGGGAAGLSARVDATFGNPIYLAVYMLFHVFIAAMLWVQSWEARRPGKRLTPSLAYGTVIALDTLVLFLTGTRGTMIGLIGGVFASLLLVAFLSRRNILVRRAAVASLAGIILLAGAFWSVRDAAWVHKVGFLSRLATISTEDNTVKARFLNWGMAWEGVKERPILGWGQENYAIVFDKYYDPRMYAQEQWFDRVHNIVFDWLVAGGFLGLISYIGIFAAALWVLWRGSGFSPVERSILTGLLAGYTVHNFFVFDNVTSYILFGTVLAYIVWRTAEARRTPVLSGARIVPGEAAPWAAALGGVLAIALVWSVNANAFAANKELLRGIAPAKGGAAENLEHFTRAISYGSLGTQEAREQLVQLATRLPGNAAGVTPDVARAFHDTAVNEMQKQMQASLLDARFPLFLGILHDVYQEYPEAEAALARAHELSPGKQTILFQQGQTALSQGKYADALATFKQAYELEPSFRDARLLYAIVLIRGGHTTEAEQMLAPLVEAGEAVDQRLALALVEAKQYGAIRAIWGAHIAAHPDDLQAYVTLAAAYYAAGDRAAAIRTLQTAQKAVPEASAQLEGFIQQIRAGTAQVL